MKLARAERRGADAIAVERATPTAYPRCRLERRVCITHASPTDVAANREQRLKFHAMASIWLRSRAERTLLAAREPHHPSHQVRLQICFDYPHAPYCREPLWIARSFDVAKRKYARSIEERGAGSQVLSSSASSSPPHVTPNKNLRGKRGESFAYSRCASTPPGS